MSSGPPSQPSYAANGGNMWKTLHVAKNEWGATCLAATANQVVQPTRIAVFKFCIVKGRFMT